MVGSLLFFLFEFIFGCSSRVSVGSVRDIPIRKIKRTRSVGSIGPIGSIRCSGRSYRLGRLDQLDLSDRADRPDQPDRSDRPRTLKFRTIPSRLSSFFHFCNIFSDVPMRVRSVKSDRRGGSAGWTEDFENLDRTLPGGGGRWPWALNHIYQSSHTGGPSL